MASVHISYVLSVQPFFFFIKIWLGKSSVYTNKSINYDWEYCYRAAHKKTYKKNIFFPSHFFDIMPVQSPI